MTPEEITEENKLISVFMGEDIDDYGYKMFGPDDYGLDWNKLMPVVEKIENSKVTTIFADYIGFSVKIVRTYCSISCHERDKQDGVIYQLPYKLEPESKIESVWLGVIAFIKWYNQNK